MTTTVLHLLAVMGVVFAINLLPAFGPPTWAVLVFIRFQWQDVPAAALIVGGALAATAGRLALALGTRRLGGRLSPERRANLEALGHTLAKSKTGVAASLAVFVFSPLPSAQMFMAAGLADVPLLPLAGAFLVRPRGQLHDLRHRRDGRGGDSSPPCEPGPHVAVGDRHPGGQPRRPRRDDQGRLDQGHRLDADASRPHAGQARPAFGPTT